MKKRAPSGIDTIVDRARLLILSTWPVDGVLHEGRAVHNHRTNWQHAEERLRGSRFARVQACFLLPS